MYVARPYGDTGAADCDTDRCAADCYGCATYRNRGTSDRHVGATHGDSDTAYSDFGTADGYHCAANGYLCADCHAGACDRYSGADA